MHLIFDAANLEWNDTVLAGDTTKIRPDALLDVRRDPAFAILCAKGDVVVEARIGVRHRSRWVNDATVRRERAKVNRRYTTVGGCDVFDR